MFKKSLPLALVAIAGCVALAPTAQKPDSTAQSANPTSAPSAQTAQKASPTPVPTPTPTPSPTPIPTPLPDNILKISFEPVSGVAGLEEVDVNAIYLGKNQIVSPIFYGAALSVSGDMYIQTMIPSTSIPILCPACDMNLSRYPNFAIFKKTNVKNEFEFVTMAKKEILGNGAWDPGKVRYQFSSRYDFTFSKLAEVASVSMAPWVVKSVDVTKKEVFFETSIWSQNTGSLKLSDVATGDFFGQDYDNYKEGMNISEPSCENVACENERALAVVRERTAFTGMKAYFIGRAKSSDAGPSSLYSSANKIHTIFRVSETGAKEIVARDIAAYFSDTRDVKRNYVELVHNLAYSRADSKFYIGTIPVGSLWGLYRVSEDALVP